MNVQSHTKDKKSKILETALELFVTQGYQQTSMSQISKDSKVAVGTIYHYFESKDVLIEELYVQVKALVADEIDLNVLENSLDLKNKIKLIWLKAFNFFKNNKTAFIFIHCNTYSTFISKEIRDKTLLTYKQAVGLVEEGIKEGVFKENDSLFLMRWIYNNIVTVLELEFDNGSEVSKTDLDKYFEMTWTSLTG